MTPSAGAKTVFYLFAIIASSLAADAAEICVKSTHRCRGHVVRLGDVADIRNAEGELAAALAAVELFPAPAANRTRLMRVGELQELLALHGLNLAGVRFSGARATIVRGVSGADPDGLTNINMELARQRVERAILSHLQTTVRSAAWRVGVELDGAGAKLLAKRLRDVKVEGGQEPWVGRQEFVLVVENSEGAARIPVRADVALPDAIVVASRAVRPGQVIRDTDVQLLPIAVPNRGFEPISRLEDAVGKEAARAISTGQPIDGRYLQACRLVRRREVVTVFARAAGVQVRTNALALDDGAFGDLIEVESIPSGKRYTARVADFEVVEVYARGPSVANARPFVASQGNSRAMTSEVGSRATASRKRQ